MVKIRLMRIGTKKRPFYRVVAVDERKKRTGGFLEILGTYNPLTEPKETILNQALIDQWVKKGAVMSDGFLRIIGKAPPKKPRKPKKEKKEVKVTPQVNEKEAKAVIEEVKIQAPDNEQKTSEIPSEKKDS